MLNHGPGSCTSKSLTQAAIATTVEDEVIEFMSNESNLTEGGLEPDDYILISRQDVCDAAAYKGLTWSKREPKTKYCSVSFITLNEHNT